MSIGQPSPIVKGFTEQVADRKLLEELFSGLYRNRIIYHERITVLSEVIKCDISDEEIQFWHTPIKLLSADPVFDGMYERWTSRPHCVVGVNLKVSGHPYIYYRKRLSMPYSGFLVWPDSEIVEKVSSLADDELINELPRLIWNRE